MNKALSDKLNQLNSKFYSNQAGNFSKTRRIHWKGWEPLVQFIPQKHFKLMDVGCGNARFAKFLIREGYSFDYLGIDFSQELLDLARKSILETKSTIRFEKRDILSANLAEHVFSNYDLVVMFGLMHHIPGYLRRLSLIKNFANQLSKNGNLIITFWQYMKSDRLATKILPREKQKEILGDLFEEMEAGDNLMDWDNSSMPRYCHNFSDEEIEKIKADLSADFEIRYEYSADGKEDNLNRYIVLEYV